MNKYTYVIIDDSEIDRLTTSAFLSNFSFLECKGTFENPLSALNYLKINKIDVLFLDIDMPELSGLELYREIEQNSVCIFITAHPDYALDGFELNALDFLIKPIQRDRFDASIKRLEDYLEIKHKSNLFDHTYGDAMIIIKDGLTQSKVNLNDIMYLEGLKDYTRLVTKSRKHTVRGTIGQLLEKDHFENFVRIHKSFAIQRIFVQKLKNDSVVVTDQLELPVGRKYKENLASLL